MDSLQLKKNLEPQRKAHVYFKRGINMEAGEIFGLPHYSHLFHHREEEEGHQTAHLQLHT